MKKCSITSNKLKFKYDKKKRELMGPVEKLELILSKINSQITQDDFNQKIHNINNNRTELREITSLGIHEKIRLNKRDETNN